MEILKPGSIEYARDKLMSAKDAEYAERLRGRGWTVHEPDAPATWRVQWISRNGVTAPDWDEGYQDFSSRDLAEAYMASEEVTSRLGNFWRVELRRRPEWAVVASIPFRRPS